MLQTNMTKVQSHWCYHRPEIPRAPLRARSKAVTAIGKNNCNQNVHKMFEVWRFRKLVTEKLGDGQSILWGIRLTLADYRSHRSNVPLPANREKKWLCGSSNNSRDWLSSSCLKTWSSLQWHKSGDAKTDDRQHRKPHKNCRVEQNHQWFLLRNLSDKNLSKCISRWNDRFKGQIGIIWLLSCVGSVVRRRLYIYCTVLYIN